MLFNDMYFEVELSDFATVSDSVDSFADKGKPCLFLLIELPGMLANSMHLWI